ncbi:MAG: hypothetical protein OCD76_03500 [Reichenbachiella sp.]
MKRGIVLVCVLMLALGAQAQFWFGPKIGGQLMTPIYNNGGRKDTFDISSKVNWHAGIAMDYSTEQLFEVHTEIVYQRVNNRATNNSSVSAGLIDSKTTNHFISTPLMLRMVFLQRSSIKVLAQVGPRLSYWIAGTGEYETDSPLSAGGDGDGPYKYKVKFADLSEEELDNFQEEGIHVVTKPNRLQYALDLGFGGIWEISPTSRVIADVKYSFGHSYMAFNDGNKLVGVDNYYEDTEYNTNMMVVSIAYMYGYNVAGRRKGRSTSTIGSKKKKYKRGTH